MARDLETTSARTVVDVVRKFEPGTNPIKPNINLKNYKRYDFFVIDLITRKISLSVPHALPYNCKILERISFV